MLAPVWPSPPPAVSHWGERLPLSGALEVFSPDDLTEWVAGSLRIGGFQVREKGAAFVRPEARPGAYDLVVLVTDTNTAPAQWPADVPAWLRARAAELHNRRMEAAAGAAGPTGSGTEPLLPWLRPAAPAGPGQANAAPGRNEPWLALATPGFVPEDYTLDVAVHGREAGVILMASSRRGLGYGLATLGSLLAEGALATGQCQDQPAFPYRGIIDGFYGHAWQWQDRAAMLEFLAANRFNLYVLAPKDSHGRRERWREPLSNDVLQEVELLVRQAQRMEVAFGFAVSPGPSLVYSDPRELEALQEKFAPFLQWGVRIFGLFYDEVPLSLVHTADQARFRSLAQAQAALATQLFAWLRAEQPEANLLVCPTQYFGDAVNSPYLAEVGRLLPAEIALLWTGQQVCSPTLTRREAEAAASVLQRRPLFWDNYPANDGTMAAELHLLAYAQREPELWRAAAGILLTPMTLPEASKIPLATAAQYLWNPRRYVPEEAWHKVVTALLGKDLEPALQVLASCNSYSCLQREDPPFLTKAIQHFRDLFDKGRARDAFAGLQETFQQVAAAANVLRSLPNAQLSRELSPWTDETEFWAQVGLLATQTLVIGARLWMPLTAEERFQAQQDLKVARQKLRAALVRSLDCRTRACGDGIRSFAADVLLRTGHLLDRE